MCASAKCPTTRATRMGNCTPRFSFITSSAERGSARQLHFDALARRVQTHDAETAYLTRARCLALARRTRHGAVLPFGAKHRSERTQIGLLFLCRRHRLLLRLRLQLANRLNSLAQLHTRFAARDFRGAP